MTEPEQQNLELVVKKAAATGAPTPPAERGEVLRYLDGQLRDQGIAGNVTSILVFDGHGK